MRPGGGGLIPAHAGKTAGVGQDRDDDGAHPRSRGENATRSTPSCATAGSSPLTRGKPRRRTRTLARCGLIPAHAGKTRSGWRVGARPGAHPRSRGENGFEHICDESDRGSSPLTRGKHPDDGADGGGLGLIPAHAGKTRDIRRGLHRKKAHPRSRGENSPAECHSDSHRGSSPLTRGKQRVVWRIPGLGGAHPRSRGENHFGYAPAVSRYGSSPLTRGKRRTARCTLQSGGLIPAHAGKTTPTRSASRSRRAHPRSRGENHRRSAPNGIKSGSSPLTRGKPYGPSVRIGPVGLIPAHAGKTTRHTPSQSRPGAHPRSRGENP